MMCSIRKIILCASLFRTGISVAQINLLPDPGFEILDSCPGGYGNIASLTFWNTPKNGGGGNPEAFNVCSTNPFTTGVPINYGNTSYQNPHSGQAYAGIDVAQSSGTGREYIQSRLLDTLVAGKAYCVTFYANLPNVMAGYIEPLGAYLDSGNVYSPTSFGLINITPQVYNTSGQLSDTLNWMKIQGSFVATGIERYITIGNYFNNASSNIGVYGTPSAWASYYYIEDVSVIDVSTPAYAGNDALINPGDSVYIGRPQEIGLNEDCIWWVAGSPIDTLAGMWVKPTTTTTYVLQQNICGTVNYDTVTVAVVGTGINENPIQVYNLYPNPADNSITLELGSLRSNTAIIEIQNVLGQIVYSEKVKTSAAQQPFSIDLSSIPNGIYFIRINGASTKKFIKN